MKTQITVLLVLLLMLVSPLALAKPDCPHPSCKPSDDPLQLPYEVWVVADPAQDPPPSSPLYQPTDQAVTPECPSHLMVAQAHSHMQNFNGLFERNQPCANLVYDDLGHFIRNISFHVTRNKKSGLIESVWFQGQARDQGTDEPFVYISEEMFAGRSSVDPEVGDLEDGPFLIHLHADGVQLWKCDTARLIGRTECNDPPVGTFAVDDMVYIPNP